MWTCGDMDYGNVKMWKCVDVEMCRCVNVEMCRCGDV